MEITNLGTTFKGADIQNLSQMSGTTSGESIAYNKLLGHRDGIIADIVRREGLPPETKVYVRAGMYVYGHVFVRVRIFVSLSV